MGYAGGHKILTYFSWVLSVMSALLALVPFWYMWVELANPKAAAFLTAVHGEL